jgi:hypothetical protein
MPDSTLNRLRSDATAWSGGGGRFKTSQWGSNENQPLFFL